MPASASVSELERAMGAGDGGGLGFWKQGGRRGFRQGRGGNGVRSIFFPILSF
jgi:hypothetical protein